MCDLLNTAVIPPLAIDPIEAPVSPAPLARCKESHAQRVFCGFTYFGLFLRVVITRVKLDRPNFHYLDGDNQWGLKILNFEWLQRLQFVHLQMVIESSLLTTLCAHLTMCLTVISLLVHPAAVVRSSDRNSAG